MPKCSFCGKTYEIPRGLTLILHDGTSLFLCSSKCRKSWEMGRKSKKLKWIKKMKHTRAEEIAGIMEEAEEKEEERIDKEVAKAEEKAEKESKKEKKDEKA